MKGQGGSLMISATSSGCGKTTFTMGLLRCLRNRGLRVQPFKCGPDYIDTMWHELASGRASVNLDTWMSSPRHVSELFDKYGADADLCVTEGVMGLFDGYDKANGSCSEIAKICDMPVILLINAKSTAYSAAAIIHGFVHFDPEVRVAGVVFNQVASENHFSYLRQACEDAGVQCLGYIRKVKDIELPSRHLGLTIDERYKIDEYLERVAQIVGETVDVEKICSLCVKQPTDACMGECEAHVGDKVISVACDAAFNFMYRANIDVLKEMGEVRFFSPIADKTIPENTDFLYLPGGYPEFYLKELSANDSMLCSVRDYINNGGHGIAECGGMLYLCRDVVGMDGIVYPMANVFHLQGTFEGMHLHLGYRQWNHEGMTMKGHEFHYSDIRELDGCEAAVGMQSSAKGTEVNTKLYKKNNFYAGYSHWYWGETPEIIRQLF